MGSRGPTMHPEWLIRPGARLTEPARAASLQPTPQSYRTTMRIIWVLPLGTGPPANTATGRFFWLRTSQRSFRLQATSCHVIRRAPQLQQRQWQWSRRKPTWSVQPYTWNLRTVQRKCGGDLQEAGRPAFPETSQLLLTRRANLYPQHTHLITHTPV